MYIKTVLLLIGLTFFSACGAANAAPQAPTRAAVHSADMSWKNAAPADNASYFYALGFGKTENEAKKDALGVISSNVSVDIASNFTNTVTATRQGDDEMLLSDAKNEVISKSKNIEYTNVEILQSDNSNGEWSVLVQVDRKILTASYQRKLDSIDTKLKSEYKIYRSSSPAQKLKVSVNIEKYLKQTDTIFPLLHAFNPYYDAASYTARYAEYTDAIRASKRDVVYKIQADENSQTLATLIRSELSAKDATFSNSNYNVLISITTKAKKKKYASTNEKFAKLTFALRKTEIVSAKRDGTVISRALYKTKEGSSKGFKDALQRTTKYKKKIKEKGITAFISGN